ncbi:metallophosphoesterase family protein [Paenibacillus sp. S150]|uniref:purple acid phosphatase family protein n=1 Tax=Paenibacillus sp. S150 TaxID=2749826 RepID=UPI001C58CAB1|nr:metallophosphoesterase family protein [Paenibacillus sp. S150]MBW4083067.1 metallophosphoesterase family protein [Paenibacillus sp. S150]
MKDFKTLVIAGIIVIVLILLALGVEWLKSDKAAVAVASGSPYDLVTTLKGDAATSRAFTWYTEAPGVDGWLEVVQGDAAAFSAGTPIKVQAASTVIQTDLGKRGVHKAEISGLLPGTLYAYRVGSGSEGEWSTVAEFSTAADDGGSVTFINVTDSQGVTAADFKLWGKTVDKAFQTFPAAQFIVHNGDFTEEPEDSAAWDSFFANVQSWVAAVPLMPVTGNHDEVEGEAASFTSHFNLPDNGAKGSIAGTSYSFDYGPVHVTVLNTESNLKKQADWLEKDLAGTDKPWTIVAMHRPAFGGNTYKKVEEWTEIFDKYQVDLVLQGHNHEYSRSYPLYGGSIVPEGENSVSDPRGTVYVVTNASGAKFNEKKEDQFYHKVHFQNGKQMFAGITVSGNTLMYQAYDIDGSKLDEFVLQH